MLSIPPPNNPPYDLSRQEAECPHGESDARLYCPRNARVHAGRAENAKVKQLAHASVHAFPWGTPPLKVVAMADRRKRRDVGLGSKLLWCG